MHWLKPDKWIAQVLTGHGTFHAFRMRCNFRDNDKCDCGMTDDNEHAIIRCKKYHEIRRVYTQIFGYGNIKIKEWIRRRDKCDALQQLAKEILEPKQVEDIIETKRLRNQRQRDQRLNRNEAERRETEQE